MQKNPKDLERRTLAFAALATLAMPLMLSLPVDALALPEHTSLLGLHLVLELFSVMIAMMIVTVSWHTFNRSEAAQGQLLIEGFLIVALCDLVHALSYEGMAPFLGAASTPRAIFFWLMARTAEALTLTLLALGWQPVLSRAESLALGGVGGLALLAWGSTGFEGFPSTFVAGEGVTGFKAGYELALCLVNGGVALLLLRRARASGQQRFYLLALSAWIIGVGELAFTHYVRPSDFQNMFGHLYKIVGYALLYGATYIVSLRAPFEALRRAERETAENEQRLRSLADNLPDVMVYQVLHSPDGSTRFLQVSAAVERLLGVTVAELLSDANAFYGRIFQDDMPELIEAQQRSLRTLEVFDMTVRMLRTDGTLRWMHLRSAPRALPDGGICYDGVQTDVTERRNSEMRRCENEAMLTAVIHSASDAVISTDVQGVISLFNPAAERIFGHSAESMLGQRLDRLLPARARERHGADLAGFTASGVSSRRMGVGRVQGLHAEGSELQLEAAISQVKVNERQVVTAVLRDVTERVRTERSLLRYQMELTELTHRLMAQEKTANSRLAQLLHDQLGQTLTAMRIDFVSEAKLSDPGQAARHARVDKLIDQSMREIRQVLVDLRPVLLDENGLADALDNELRGRQRSAPTVRLSLEVAEGLAQQRWMGEVEYAAFMVAREALANALQHAQAKEIVVSLEGDASRLRLCVSDDGRGLADAGESLRVGHLGLVGMRERSIAIGARFELGASPQGGTLICMRWDEADA